MFFSGMVTTTRSTRADRFGNRDGGCAGFGCQILERFGSAGIGHKNLMSQRGERRVSVPPICPAPMMPIFIALDPWCAASWGWPGITPAAILPIQRLARRSDPG
jgi:hypothetical protein